MGAVGNDVLQVPENVEDLPLLDNQHIVEAHYGTAELVREQDASLTQIYVIPIHLREVRPSMIDLPQMEVGSSQETHNAVLPAETALLKRLENETSVDMELAEKAIVYIKKYHGLVKQHSGAPSYLHPIAANRYYARLYRGSSCRLSHPAARYRRRYATDTVRNRSGLWV